MVTVKAEVCVNRKLGSRRWRPFMIFRLRLNAATWSRDHSTSGDVAPSFRHSFSLTRAHPPTSFHTSWSIVLGALESSFESISLVFETEGTNYTSETTRTNP